MKHHTIRKLKNKVFPKRGASLLEWNKCLKELNLKNIQESDCD